VSFFFGAEIDNLDQANASVLGLCWDKGSSFRTGSAKSPKVIRDYTNSKLYNSFTEAGLNIRDHWRIFDKGDVYPRSIIDAISLVKEKISKQSDLKLNIFLGGDHSITIAALKVLKDISDGSWGLVYFDAHPDMYETYERDPFSHACTVRRLIDDGVVQPEHIFQVGIRAATEDQSNYAREKGVSALSTANVVEMSAKEISSNIKETLGDTDSIYVSFDVDVLDPAFAPGVGNPEGGGITMRKLAEIIQGLKGLKVGAFDVVEANPDYDCVGITFYSVSKIIREMLGAIVIHSD
jgi:agmatinase